MKVGTSITSGLTKSAFCIAVLLMVVIPVNAENVLLAEAEGKQGSIRVEEKDRMRLLTIDGVVQGGIPVGLSAVQRVIDPMVELIRAVRPEAGTALVIGLGTGKTASDLSSVGVSVEVVELEPVVIEFARRFFNYRGAATEADGLEYLKETERCYDVILMDAFSGEEAPAHLVSREALRLMEGRLKGPEGLLAARLLARPDDLEVGKLLRDMRPIYTQVFGSGVGSEKQNLYVLHSSRTFDVGTVRTALPLPVTTQSGDLLLGRHRSLFGNQSKAADTRSATYSPKMVVLGYLIRAKETGDICIDLPHRDMGAGRYLVEGDALPELSDLAKDSASFPTAGDMPGDDDKSETLHVIMGGSYAARSDVRSSKVLVAVEGIARVRSMIDPDLAAEDRRPREVLLPRGGILYEFDASRVLMSLDYERWRKFRSEKLKAKINRAKQAFAASGIEKAAEAIGDYLKAVDARLNGFGSKCPLYNDLARYKLILDTEISMLAERTSPLKVAVACDVAEGCVRGFLRSEDAAIIRNATRECAERNYMKVAMNPEDANAPLAASRLLCLLREPPYKLDQEHPDRFSEKVKELQELYKGIEPLFDIPFGKEHREELDRQFRKKWEELNGQNEGK